MKSGTESADTATRLPSHAARGGRPRSGLVRWLTGPFPRLLLKLAIAAAVVAVIVYRVAFAPLPVRAWPVERGEVVAEVMGTGTLEARVRAAISPRISGRLAQVLADQGDRMTKGQLLATLDDGDLRQQVEIARASLAAAQASVERAATEINRAEVTAKQKKADHTRISELKGKELVSASDYEKSDEQLQLALADLARVQAARTEAQKQVVTAEQTLKYQEERLADTRINCPFDGLVVKRDRDPGDVVVPGGAILEIISTDQVWVSAWVDESAMASLEVDQPARIVFRSEPQRSYPGAVARLAPQADRETREFLVDVTAKELPKTWAIGQRAEVYIQTARKDDVPVVPLRTIVWRDGQAGVFVADQGKARWRKITLGLRGQDRAEVVSGLAVGEAAITLKDPANGGGPANAGLSDGRAVQLP